MIIETVFLMKKMIFFSLNLMTMNMITKLRKERDSKINDVLPYGKQKWYSTT